MMTREACAAIIRDIWGNPWRHFYFEDKNPDPKWGNVAVHPEGETVHWLNPDWLTYANSLVPKLAKAAVTRECYLCPHVAKIKQMPLPKHADRVGDLLDPAGVSCGKCKGTGTVSLTGPIDPFRLVVIADALEECQADAGLLLHLRDPSLTHIWTASGGCWVLSLLLSEQ